MGNELDEMKDPVLEEGRDVNVIAKQISVTTSGIEKAFPYLIALIGIIPLVIGVVLLMNQNIVAGIVFIILAFIPAVCIYFTMKKAEMHLNQLQQKVQSAASQIDNYLEERVQVLSNCAQLVNKAVKLDQTTFTEIARLRSNHAVDDTTRNDIATAVDKASREINVAFENYPDLKAHQEIADAMQQNLYIQKEITAARGFYNDVVLQWNADIFEFPIKKIVASKKGYTTRIPFAASAEVKARARETFFE